MKKILHVISSPRGEASISIKLGNGIIEKIKIAHPDSVVKERNLIKNLFPHLEEAHIASFFTPAENRTPENLIAIKHSDEAIAEIMEADIIVIDAPVYNYAIHSTLKAYFDHIARAGVTFRYSENGAEGLVTGKKVYLAIASGGIYSEGPMQSFDFVAPYIKTFLGFLGITDITVVRAEGMGIPVVQDTALEKGLESVVIAD
jgi:FMN-dependent NADH-azoreductase